MLVSGYCCRTVHPSGHYTWQKTQKQATKMLLLLLTTSYQKERPTLRVLNLFLVSVMLSLSTRAAEVP